MVPETAAGGDGRERQSGISEQVRRGLGDWPELLHRLLHAAAEG